MSSPQRNTWATWSRASSSVKSTRALAFQRTERVVIPRKMTTRSFSRECRTRDFGRWARSTNRCKKWPCQIWLIKICHCIDLLKTRSGRENSYHRLVRKKSPIVKLSTLKWTRLAYTVSFCAQTPSFMQTLPLTRCTRCIYRMRPRVQSLRLLASSLAWTWSRRIELTLTYLKLLWVGKMVQFGTGAFKAPSMPLRNSILLHWLSQERHWDSNLWSTSRLSSVTTPLNLLPQSRQIFHACLLSCKADSLSLKHSPRRQSMPWRTVICTNSRVLNSLRTSSKSTGNRLEQAPRVSTTARQETSSS